MKPLNRIRGIPVRSHREAQRHWDMGHQVYGSPYDGSEEPVRLRSAEEILRYDPENLVVVEASDPKGNPVRTILRELGRNVDFAVVAPDDEVRSALIRANGASKRIGGIPIGERYGMARTLPKGTPVDLRIDIPTFNRTGTYVVTVHKPKTASGGPGDVIGYDSIAKVTDPTFVVRREVRAIYEGRSNKFPVATVHGRFDPSRDIPPDIDDWTPVGMDPKEHAFFYDKRTDRPVVSGKAAISVGNTVFVKDPVYGSTGDYPNPKRNPAGDREYMAAVERGDMETAQRMVDAAAADSDIPWSGVVDLRDGKILKTYTRRQAGSVDFHHSMLVDARHLAMIRDGDAEYFFINQGVPASMNGLPPGIVRRIREQLGRRIKSADPVTYDDAGNVIPLSKRFDPSSEDVRNPRRPTPPQFPFDYADYLRRNFPDIWGAGGNIRGNDAFRWWSAYRRGDRSPTVMHWWEVTRPAWIARHFDDHRLPGVVAQIKWGTVGRLGVAGMKRVVEDAIRRKR